MKRIFFVLSIAISACAFSSCFTNPITGRKTVNAVSEDEMRTMASAEYKKFLAANPPVNGTPESEMVKKVGNKLATATQQYLTSIGKANLIQGYQWEFNLVNSKEVNAWCMPGGKVVVYSGILPQTQDETGLAVVLGHEIAHAVARHSNERFTDQYITQFGTQVLSSVVKTNSDAVNNIFDYAVGISGTGLLLKFSRNQESEADEMGLYLMAMAGYNPEQAIPFWQRMGSQGAKVWELASSHPSDETRIKNIQKFLPKAKQYYKPQ
ncbi:MAG: M48 family metallopeptidase [Flavipsychrobacter sp.]|nr:M48 family metallopeptidase [Flavipsychrobacter sp.]